RRAGARRAGRRGGSARTGFASGGGAPAGGRPGPGTRRRRGRGGRSCGSEPPVRRVGGPMTGAVPGQVVIGLDVGTTGVKAVAFGLGSSWRRMALREYRLLQPGPDQEVQDPAAIIAATGAALAECVAAAGSAQVLAISVSTGMHGLMALDDRGRPLTPLLTWADGRAREEARWLRGSGHARTLHALTGTP